MFDHSAAAYLDDQHMFFTDARRPRETLDRIEEREGIPQNLADRLEDVDKDGIIWGAFDWSFPDVSPRAKRAEITSALGIVRSAQRVHFAQYNTYVDDIENLDLTPADFQDMNNVSYEDLRVVSGDEDGFIAKWEGDIEGFAYTQVTIDERGNVEKSGKREIEKIEEEKNTVAGTYSVSLTGEKMKGIDAWFVFESTNEELIEEYYTGIREYLTMLPMFFQESLDMPDIGRLVTGAFEQERIGENKLRFSFKLEDELPELLGLIPPMRKRMAEARGRARRAACASNLRQVGMVLQMYAQENEGRFPKGETSGKIFKILEEKGTLGSLELLNCPANPVDEVDLGDPDGVGYYIDPAIPEEYDRQRVIAADRSPWERNHDGEGVNVLFADGSVKFIRPEDSGPEDKISNPHIEEDTDIYADTGDPEKHAWIRWEREK